MQIRSKLTVQFFLITAALLLSALVSIYFFASRIQKDEFYSLLEARANTTADLLIRVEEVDSSMLKLIDLNKKDVLYDENISVYDNARTEIYTNNDSLHFSDILPDLDAFLDDVNGSGKKRLSLDELDVVGVKYIDKSKQFVVVASAIDLQGMKNLKNLRQILIVVYLVILLAIGFAGWLFSGRALKPIAKLNRQINNISANNLSDRLDEGNKKDEIANLTITFNHLLDRLEHAFRTQKLFVSNASHELRNPLTMITSQLEVSLLKVRSAEDYQKILSSVLEDIKRLNEMSHRLLTLTKMESDSSDFKLKRLRLDDLLWESKAEFLTQKTGCNAVLTLSKLPENENELTILGNEQFLKTCFYNLMDNACKFSHDNQVHVDLKCESGKILISFTNFGSFIDPEDLPHIFEPFYRGKNSGKVSGYGIGLSMVDRIVKVHHGSTQVISDQHNGTTLTVSFPMT